MQKQCENQRLVAVEELAQLIGDGQGMENRPYLVKSMRDLKRLGSWQLLNSEIDRQVKLSTGSFVSTDDEWSKQLRMFLQNNYSDDSGLVPMCRLCSAFDRIGRDDYPKDFFICGVPDIQACLGYREPLKEVEVR